MCVKQHLKKLEYISILSNMKMYRVPSGTLQVVIGRNKLYLKAAFNVWNKICVFLTAENKTFSKTRLSCLGSPHGPMLCEMGKEGHTSCSFPPLMGGKVLLAFLVCLLFHSVVDVKTWKGLFCCLLFKVRLPTAGHQASPPCLAHLGRGCSPVSSPLLSVNHFTSPC